MNSLLARFGKRLVAKVKGSKGLRGLDLELIKEIKPKLSSPGFYIELGANDGISQSNTFLLQKKYGWRGLLIEASPMAFVKCLKNRNFANIPQIACCACVPFSYKERFVEIEESNLMSTCKGLRLSDEEASIQADKGSVFLQDERQRIVYGSLARTLTSILIEKECPKTIDLLSLDVEGNEISVLQGIDFDQFFIDWILIEVRNTTQGSAMIHDFLNDHGYITHKILASNESYQDILFKYKGVDK